MSTSDCRFVWYELATTDAEAAKAFYTRVVGWSAPGVAVPGYALFVAGGAPVAGLTELRPGASEIGLKPQWIGYVGVDDVDAAASHVGQLGGTVHIPPTTIQTFSRFSVVADPQKATVAMIKGLERGREQSPQPGSSGGVVWHELSALDTNEAFTFYNKLFGWKSAGPAPGAAGGYREFTAGADPIGGMCDRADNQGHSTWIHYFSVRSMDAAVKRVVAAGGQIIYGPVALQGATRLAQCVDPQGAVFGLMDVRMQIAIACYRSG
jgi:uncharacterized protein